MTLQTLIKFNLLLCLDSFNSSIFPIYYFYIYNKDNDKWTRHYDLKTGNFKVNTGHIICMQEGEQYEKWSGHILLAQSTCYKDQDKIVKELHTLIENKKLTWGERNDLFQIFLKNNLHKYPNINPSFVLKTQLFYEISNIRPHKSLSSLIESSTCLENIEESQKTLSECVTIGGQKCYENYIKHPGNNMNIKKALEEMIEETKNIYNL